MHFRHARHGHWTIVQHVPCLQYPRRVQWQHSRGAIPGRVLVQVLPCYQRTRSNALQLLDTVHRCRAPVAKRPNVHQHISPRGTSSAATTQQQLSRRQAIPTHDWYAALDMGKRAAPGCTTAPRRDPAWTLSSKSSARTTPPQWPHDEGCSLVMWWHRHRPFASGPRAMLFRNSGIPPTGAKPVLSVSTITHPLPGSGGTTEGNPLLCLGKASGRGAMLATLRCRPHGAGHLRKASFSPTVVARQRVTLVVPWRCQRT